MDDGAPMTALDGARPRDMTLRGFLDPFSPDPIHPGFHLFEVGGQPHVLVVDGSRVYGLDPESARTLARQGDSALAELGLVASSPYVDDEAPASFPLRSLSLAVAQKCNLGCTYCYAQEGAFGGEARAMTLQVAQAAVERLLAGASPGDRVHLSFLGGEPLVNRSVLRAATELAVERGRDKGVEVGLAVTTNGTLLTPEDGDFFERHGFAVTVSLDGVGPSHDRLRPFKGGRGSYETVLARIRPLLARQRRMQVSARVTVTPRNLALGETLDEFVELGFHSVGFSPMLSSPSGRDEMGSSELDTLLGQMVDCGRKFEERVNRRERYPFSNMVQALKEIHRGTHRPYPCGAGAGYLGVGAQGDLFACHRFVDDEKGALGSLEAGLHRERQATWLKERHVHRQEPCNRCWARYLCGGGCHHEVIHRGRPACDYIRGWLNYCLQAYTRLLESCPEYFSPASPGASGA